MSSSGYTPWAVTAGEIPTTAYWNLLGSNDASFNTGNGFNDGILINRHFSNGAIQNKNLAVGAVGVAINTTAGEVTYTNSTWVAVSGSAITITTTQVNQTVTVFSQFQTYSGGYSQFQYQLDGSFTGNSSKYQTGVNGTTTGMLLFMDNFPVPTAGTHTIQLYANGGGGLRIIHSEGVGRTVAFLS